MGLNTGAVPALLMKSVKRKFGKRHAKLARIVNRAFENALDAAPKLDTTTGRLWLSDVVNTLTDGTIDGWGQ